MRPAPDDLRSAAEERRELAVAAVAPPAALVVAALLVSSAGGRGVVRTFLSMWVHELGHAVTAWLCGFSALPGPWFTSVSPERHVLLALLLAGSLGTLAWRAWHAERRGIFAAACALLAVQAVGTLLLRPHTAEALVTFGGDAGAMVLGAGLVATIWTDPQGPLGRGALRWGFLAIGAAALVDALDSWVRAWRDPGELPLGEIGGVGLSDASKLMEVHGWSAAALSGRYVALGVACLAALGAGWALAVGRARARVVAADRVARAERLAAADRAAREQRLAAAASRPPRAP